MIHLGGVTGDAFGHRDTLFGGLMRQHGPAMTSPMA